MKELIRRIIQADALYKGDGMMLALYFMVLILIIFAFKESRMRKSFALPSAIFLVIIYIGLPLTGHDIIKAYVRFFWLLLTPAVTALGFTYLIYKTDKRKMRILLILLTFPLFFLCGTFQITNYRFKPYENMYRLPQAAVDITEKVLSEKESPRLIVPYTIAHPFRQISSDVKLLFGEDATYKRIKKAPADMWVLAEEMEHVTPDLNLISEKMQEYDCDYIVFDTVYTELCENGNINVHGYPVDSDYVGDRTSSVDYSSLHNISISRSGDEPYWDLSSYDLEYTGTYGQYILYKRN